MTATTTYLEFPSLEWFRAAARIAKEDEAQYHKLGVVDVALGIAVGDDRYRLVFEDFGCSSVAAWDGTETVDCVIAGAPSDWMELIQHIATSGWADPEHTLNSLVLAGDRFRLEGADQLAIDRFYRYNATIQAFFDGSSALLTRFG